jgi:hypothetical protein
MSEISKLLTPYAIEFCRLDLEFKDNSKELWIKKFRTNVIIEIKRIIGTKTPEILSASFEMGAFELLASSTSFIILENVESSPTLVAFILM